MFRLPCCTIALLLAGASCLQASVLLNSSTQDAIVNHYKPCGGASDQQTSNSTAVPDSFTLSASVPGSTATTQVTRSQSLFDYAIQQCRPTGYDPHPNGTSSYTENRGHDTFTITSPTDYTIQGTYTMTGAGRILFYFSLTQLQGTPPHDPLPYDYHESYFTPNESFTFGVPGGEHNNFAGLLTGTLQPGQYMFYYQALIQATENHQCACATGDVSIAFRSSVPEPSTLVVWSLLAVGIVGMGIRGKRRA